MFFRLRPLADRWAWRIMASVYGLIVLGGFTAGEGIEATVLAALLAPLLYRGRTVRVVTGPDGVRVRNLLWTYRLRWDSIERFALGTAHLSGYSFPDTCTVVMKNGRTISVMALGAAKVGRESEKEELGRMVATLNSELARRSGRA